MGRLLKESSGFALILTILVISLLVALTLQFNVSMRADLYGAANLRDGTKLACIAKSGVNLACAVLFKDALDSKVDSLTEAWADSKTLSSASALMFEQGRFEVQITDHSGRIQINQLVDKEGKYNPKQKDLISRFLSSAEFGLDAQEVGNLLDALKDWIDPDNEVTGFGEESSYYQALQVAYSCRNGPMEYLEELLLVKGITRELFYGTQEKPGISHYLTVYGDGKININTAAPLVLGSLSDQLDQEMIQDMVVYREDEQNDLKDLTWYKKVPGISDVTIDPELVTTASTYFEITSNAIKEAMSKRVKSMIDRKEGTPKILSWKVE